MNDQVSKQTNESRVPVFSIDGKPLSPTTPARARKLVNNQQARPGRHDGRYCLHMTVAVGEVVPHN